MSIQSTGLRSAGKTKLLLAAVVAAGAAVALSSTAARATVIYSQTFSAQASGALNLVAPTTGPSGQDWLTVAGNFYPVPATGGTLDTKGYGSYLPFKPAQGNIYELSATLDPISSSNNTNWLSVGFGSGIPASNQGPAMLLRVNGEIGLSDGTTGSAGTAPTTSGSYTTNELAEVVLNTMSTAWTATWYYNNVDLGSVTYTTNPTITGVAIGSNAVNGQFNSFELQTVPEPTALGLLGIGAVGLLLAARRKRA
ncbi:MAG: PEP-CTERM sorting domain-containing protein [Phycisphaerae bacterium]